MGHRRFYFCFSTWHRSKKDSQSPPAGVFTQTLLLAVSAVHPYSTNLGSSDSRSRVYGVGLDSVGGLPSGAERRRDRGGEVNYLCCSLALCVQYLADTFSAAGCLDKLRAFACEHAARFFGFSKKGEQMRGCIAVECHGRSPVGSEASQVLLIERQPYRPMKEQGNNYP